MLGELVSSFDGLREEWSKKKEKVARLGLKTPPQVCLTIRMLSRSSDACIRIAHTQVAQLILKSDPSFSRNVISTIESMDPRTKGKDEFNQVD